MATLTTRIFYNRNSQAVRIPQAFRLDVSEVEINRNANGDLVIHPLPLDRGIALPTAIDAFDEAFANQLKDDYRLQPLMQDHEAL